MNATVMESVPAAAAGAVTRLTGGPGEPALLVRHAAGQGPSVIYVHGATFPSALSVAYRFGGHSWMDDLQERGFDVWSFDFAGYGGSDRPASFTGGASSFPPSGRAAEATAQLARVIEHVLRATGQRRVSLIAHSWGSIVAGRYASLRPERIKRLVLFGPICRRQMPGLAAPESVGAWRLVTVAEQLARFVEDVPEDHAPVLIEPELSSWGPAYLASDPGAAASRPAAVRIPAGPRADILAAWSGELGYEPADVSAPTLIVRGAWDSLCTDADADWLRQRLDSEEVRDVVIPAGTHLMHLEHARAGLFEAAAAFLMKAWL
ncbi:alpha/beta fold hydrolase [Bosea sp. (in: a-proteobacteria)]|jgi:pimeloyl-ACP methyl ester carboxylesterase|uniref:alpha/beta fold hydrolase n=1 Tax=Bosea sp. (in: a-proteobacteria) TaxID=1871050 RepID=UPI003F7153BC